MFSTPDLSETALAQHIPKVVLVLWAVGLVLLGLEFTEL